jgi:glycosyltransferase involved in cell wall biosynthesis
MKCWIASFPRSGNTYFRNILYYVYGLESSTWHKETAYPVDEKYSEFAFVKTHLRPGDLIPTDPKIPAIYLVRDGRDAMVSIAHHRSDIVAPGSDFYTNLKEAILAAEGSFFGGWSTNVNEWIERAQLIIPYEALIENPKKVFEKVEQWVEMPPARWENLPDFTAMKFGKPHYGGQTTSKNVHIDPSIFAQKFFRKGKAGGWKEEMPKELQDLFHRIHGDTLERMGYAMEISPMPQNPVLDHLALQKLGAPSQGPAPKRPIKVLIEGSKLQISKNDGVKRYLIQLLKGLEEYSRHGEGHFHFDLLIHHRILPLKEYLDHIRSEVADKKYYEKLLLLGKKCIQKCLPSSVYNPLARRYRESSARAHLRSFRSWVFRQNEKELIEKFESVEGGYDLIHLPLPQNYRAIEKLKGQVVVTIHDLTHKLFPEFHTEENIGLSEEGIQYCLHQSAHFLCISEHTRQDLLAEYGMDPKDTSTVPESADKELFYENQNTALTQLVRNKYNLGQSPFFLCLSTLEPRKNLKNTLLAFDLFKKQNPEADIKLVIAGEKGWKYESLLQTPLSFEKDIIFTGFVEDRDLHVLYSEALVFCYLSFYEGFGLPPLEAAACKTAILHSGAASLAEVIGDAGWQVSPEHPSDIAEGMHVLYHQKELREALAQKGFDRGQTYGWRKTIFQTLEVYKSCVSTS